MIISFVIPAYKASETIGETLSSIVAATMPEGWSLDIIVSNDGSPDEDALKAVVHRFEGVTYLSHEQNRGKCAAMNFSIPHSRGEIVVILDADDTLVRDWPARLTTVLQTWPHEAPICFTACRTEFGESTVSKPHYTGPLSFNDMLNERYMGEYLPMFRGDALRASKGYRDPKEPFACELWTYLGFSEHADLWISAEILRVYHTDRPGSITATMFSPKMAERMVRCYDLVFADFEPSYRSFAPRRLSSRRLRQSVFAVIAGQKTRAWSLWKTYAGWYAPLESIVSLFMITLGPKTIGALVGAAKRTRILRRYG